MLSFCKVALEQGRLLWRHNNIVKYIVQNIDQKYVVHSDVEGYTTPNGGTIPAALTVTGLKPDITVFFYVLLCFIYNCDGCGKEAF